MNYLFRAIAAFAVVLTCAGGALAQEEFRHAQRPRLPFRGTPVDGGGELSLARPQRPGLPDHGLHRRPHAPARALPATPLEPGDA